MGIKQNKIEQQLVGQEITPVLPIAGHKCLRYLEGY
jgi:hypothetical protein